MTEETQMIGRVHRVTKETDILMSVTLRGQGHSSMSTGIPFLEHMLEQVSRHGRVDLSIEATGDLHIDGHHLVEDLGIVFGEAFAKALGDKKDIARFGYAYAPLDESLSRVVLDLSGRPGLVYNPLFKQERVGDFELPLFAEFFHGFVSAAKVTLHVDVMRGESAHHQAESMFKAFALAIKAAVREVPGAGIPSTKGRL